MISLQGIQPSAMTPFIHGILKRSAIRRIAWIPLVVAAEPATRSPRHLKSIIIWTPEATDLNASPRTRTDSMRRVAAKHCHSRPKLGSSKRDHVFPRDG